MRVLAYLRRLLATLHEWWQQELEEVANAAPYPLDEEEWEFLQAQEAVRRRRELAAEKAKGKLDERSSLAGRESGVGR